MYAIMYLSMGVLAERLFLRVLVGRRALSTPPEKNVAGIRFTLLEDVAGIRLTADFDYLLCISFHWR